MSYRGRGRGNYHNGGGQRNNNYNDHLNGGLLFGNNTPNTYNNFAQQQNRVQVEVFGWNNASPADVVSFLSRKTRIGLMDHSVNQANGAVTGYVRSQKDADSLVNWNGVKFAGQSLKINVVSGGGNQGALSSATISTMESLKEFLRLRYNPAMKMLDLSNMQNDQLLISRGLMTPNAGSSSTSSKMFLALMKLASQDSSIVVETVNLSNNSFNDTFNNLSVLGATFPNLLNLSLENNRIARTKFFESWKSKFSNLRELVLINNPVQQATNYQFELMKIFPKLILLDGHILRDEEKIRKIFRFPVPTKQMFFETPDIQNISTSFITNYLKCWDNNRQDLVGLYSSPESQFSLEIDPSHPASYHPEDSQLWSYYMPNSRNLSRISNERSRMARLHKGGEDIYKVFQQVPKTKHSLLESPSLFSMESYAYPQVNGIIITLHGEYEEVGIPDVVAAPSGPRNYQNRYNNNTLKGTLTKRSFDRTFVVVQGANQSMIIASDLLLIRPYGSEKAWIETPPPNSAPGSTLSSAVSAPPSAAVSGAAVPVVTSAPVANGQTMVLLQQQVPPDILNSLSPQQQQLLAKVYEETRLNAEFSLMLCQQSNWDYQTCINSFNGSKANIPLSAYQQ